MMCSLETYSNFKACLFTGMSLLVLNMSQFFLAIHLGFPDFLLKDDHLIQGCLAIGLLTSFCLIFGANNDRPRPRSGKPFLATVFLAIVQLGLHLALIIFPIDDLSNNEYNVWVSSCIGMSTVDFWTIFVAFKANKKISSIPGYQEIA
jgi:hypothetical protein